MKKIIKTLIIISILGLTITGCGIKNSNNIIKDLKNKLENSNSYYLEGTMSINNNEDTYTYDVKVSFKKDNYYKVELTNTLNNHKQVMDIRRTANKNMLFYKKEIKDALFKDKLFINTLFVVN